MNPHHAPIRRGADDDLAELADTLVLAHSAKDVFLASSVQVATGEIEVGGTQRRGHLGESYAMTIDGVGAYFHPELSILDASHLDLADTLDVLDVAFEVPGGSMQLGAAQVPMNDHRDHWHEVLRGEVQPEGVLGLFGERDGCELVFQVLVVVAEGLLVRLVELDREERIAFFGAAVRAGNALDSLDDVFDRVSDQLFDFLGSGPWKVNTQEHPIEGDLAHELAWQLHEAVAADDDQRQNQHVHQNRVSDAEPGEPLHWGDPLLRAGRSAGSR